MRTIGEATSALCVGRWSKAIAPLTCALTVALSWAQWNTNPSGIHFTSGNVGIGTNNPTFRLTVQTDRGTSAIYGLHLATSGSFYGVFGESRSSSGFGVFGLAAASTGVSYGVYGRSNSTSGYGLFGYAAAASGTTFGVYGRADSPEGRAVYGVATATTGSAYGVVGESRSTSGWGVYGTVTATTGATRGVYGISRSNAGVGVYGLASATTGATTGVYGRSDSPEGVGVYGVHQATTGTAPGVYGLTRSNSGNAVGVLGEVLSTSPGAFSAAVRGINRGTGGNGIGVWGSQNGSGWGVYGTSVSGIGVYGEATATTGTTYGVYGQVSSPSGFGGYFVGRGYFEYNSTIANAILRLHETEADFVRLEFTNTNTARKWHIAGFIGSAVGNDRLNLWNSQTGDIISLSGDGSVAIGSPLLYTAQLNISANSDLNRATLRLHEVGNDPSRIEFTNTNAARKWHIAGFIGSAVGDDRLNLWNSQTGDIISISGDGSVAIGPPSLYTARLTVSADSDLNRATLRLHETTNNDVARIEFTNANTARKWHIAGFVGTGGPETDRLSIWNSNSGDLLWVRGNGNVGIGTTNPEYRLHVETNAISRAIFANQTATSGFTYAVYGQASSSLGTGVRGLAASTTGAAWGVQGTTNSNASDAYGVVGFEPSGGSGHAVYAQGSFAATVKSFQIDHPLSPETHYLNHFCFEGPEPQNVYNGVVILDERGEAWVQLPDYFEAINCDPRYTLTPIGAPMPNLHVAVEIQNNRFKIAGGTPGRKVSWEVKAIRNDLYMQRYGFQTEQEKEPEIRGKYLHPELYGQPKEKGILYRPEPAVQTNEVAKP